MKGWRAGWLGAACYLLEEASGVLADLDEAGDDVVEVEVAERGVVSALSLHLAQQQVPAVQRRQHVLILPANNNQDTVNTVNH